MGTKLQGKYYEDIKLINKWAGVRARGNAGPYKTSAHLPRVRVHGRDIAYSSMSVEVKKKGG